ncbi:MAG: hypothetical protein A2268_16695 [Candidatus Raymondbacteria bacterium RifOxyA12_full_50_37]|uniref:LSM domain-containing protein n=1 Tax=Candidatus Raymondbacteria bacterium RIFOXYD12_FULL_49_13 TaxID=1817890 RepID=A0A1F7F4F4_UNCRA|nr:MAG: hypothetical protein A2268_16695 [Candidatus Raymondbacteria bacterium RifOxyA12_full_50_37]OGJ86249.1 MAG: hypothetical protein A2248_16285 [Candidatus Raymondbacteria bacterium RIFOXYA2_FULL_49_16]OGJ95787.1 MAG: hypothetical protein A2453_11605 [Candidatus Raymondbacteria bacterium RIFOXYC2_FULL_50_21]OGK01453.1 MAG: hypothetical protein A2519_19195 [Candidatus Raymondbacteria bacterium RIFOXYD12_FULL_49_13]OGK03938.1 MAG: hypothetical protein A2487_12110 [Candidatus Raymondbacteria 
MKFIDFLRSVKDEKRTISITFGDKLSLTCSIIETYDDFIKVNLMTFDKTTTAFSPTQKISFVPVSTISFVEILR